MPWDWNAPSKMMITVGVLALQGAFVEHLALLRQAADSIVVQDLSQSSQHQQPQGDARQRSGAHVNTGSSGFADAGQPYYNNEENAGVTDGDPGQQHERQQQQASHEAQGPEAEADGQTLQDDPQHACASPNPPSTSPHAPSPSASTPSFSFTEVRTPQDLALCTALIIPGGESTAISLIAARTGLLEPLRDFVKVARRPVWGTCAGLILLAERADRSKATGQELIGGLDVRVQRNYFGRQVESFEAELELGFLGEGERFRSVFIRAPVVAKVLEEGEEGEGSNGDGIVVAPPKSETRARVEVLGRLPGRAKTIRDRTTTAEDLGEDGDIIAVKQGNAFGTAFHPELTGDGRIHAWWLREVVRAEQERLRAQAL